MSFLKNILRGKEKVIEPTVLLEEQSPCCPITAVVEQDNRVAYFYLWGPEESSFGVKSCWIRNLEEAPSEIEFKKIKKGISPMLPKANCVNPSKQELLKKDSLSIVWLEEGDGAALLENGEIIAVIPSWGGKGGFNGYSSSCKGEGEFAWELNQSNEMHQRVEDSKDFWSSWEDEISPFQINQSKILDVYTEFFGASEKYFAIDDEEGAPRGLYVRQGEQKTVFATVALSLSPMPEVEMYTEDRFELNRIELGLMLNTKHCASRIQDMSKWISGICSLPWKEITFLAEGHTIYFDAFENDRFKSALLTQYVSALAKVEFEKYRQSTINFLWLIPITEKEREFAMEHGSERLIERMNGIGQEILSLDRNELI